MIIRLILLNIIPLYIHAQTTIFSPHGVGIAVNYSHVGLNVASNYSFQKTEKIKLNIGIKVLVNRPIYDNRRFTYRHRFYANNPGEAIGGNIGVERAWKLRESCISPFVFASVQVTRAHIRNRMEYVDSTTVYQPLPQTVYFVNSNYKTSPLPLYAFENIIGVGFTVQVYKNFDLRLSAGGSFVYILENGGTVGSNKYYSRWEFGDYYSLGVNYRFVKRE